MSPAITYTPPIELLEDIEIPDRSNMKTVGDMIRVILADDEAMQAKNAGLKALRKYTETLQKGVGK